MVSFFERTWNPANFDALDQSSIGSTKTISIDPEEPSERTQRPPSGYPQNRGVKQPPLCPRDTCSRPEESGFALQHTVPCSPGSRVEQATNLLCLVPPRHRARNGKRERKASLGVFVRPWLELSTSSRDLTPRYQALTAGSDTKPAGGLGCGFQGLSPGCKSVLFLG